MKKMILCALVTLATAAYAQEMPQFIITDCGTIHQIPDDATVDEACDWLDFWSSIDC